ncbi:YraN family protein [Paracoccus laeviglucosivorans]|uniref:Putative endonuclease n=1 Tax=Paracoccus laeviglucosivorans TaxID=1197861 RepID=A0A521C0W5_9RHOB|nr:YraN family protein [Paracoccus laeviglucosivorans]SMO53015.1 putative endonuclease [Paracoccus laeviglucosivorans]
MNQITASRKAKGSTAYSAGGMGEDSVSRDYLARGYALIASRWRGKSGEIDLIMQRDNEYIFIEVKKSASHRQAAERIDRRQMDRICHAALEFCGGQADGLMTLMRFDAALVDHTGRVEVIENAFGMA